MSEDITVRVLKYGGGAEHRRWQARIREALDGLLILDAEFDVDVEHDSLGTIARGTRTVEYYWFDRWYNIFEFLERDGRTKLFYCNINTPPSLKGNVLSYVDLDIDVLVKPDLSYDVLDLDEFETNAQRYGYSDEVRRNAEGAVDQLRHMIEDHQFPFGGNLRKVRKLLSDLK